MKRTREMLVPLKFECNVDYKERDKEIRAICDEIVEKFTTGGEKIIRSLTNPHDIKWAAVLITQLKIDLECTLNVAAAIAAGKVDPKGIDAPLYCGQLSANRSDEVLGTTGVAELWSNATASIRSWLS